MGDGLAILIITVPSFQAALRLKRWLVAGSVSALDPLMERQSHIAIGGRNLRELASETDWGEFDHAELDYMLDNL